MVKNIRDIGLDNIKTLLVFLVILGHVIQKVYIIEGIEFDNSLLFRVIYSFHMPLFMAISGYLYSWEKSISLKRYSFFLLIPFFSWGIIEAIIYGVSPLKVYQVMFRLIKYPDSGLWYLFVLFQIIFICELVKRSIWIRIKHPALLGIAFLFYCMYLVLDINDYGASQLFWIFPFFIIGSLFKSYGYFIELMNIKVRAALSFFSFLASAFLLKSYARVVTHYDSMFGFTETALLLEFFSIKYLLALLIITLVMFNLNKFKKISLFKNFFAMNSLAFYATQNLIIEAVVYFTKPLIWSNLQLQVATIFLSVTVITSVIIMLINKTSILRKFLYGR